MKILHVIPGLTHERGGPSTALEALTRHQAMAGHTVRVLTTNQGLGQGEHPIKLADQVSFERLHVLGPQGWAFAPQLKRRLRETLPACDIVHVHSLFNYPTDAAARLATRFGRPWILRPCGLLDPRAMAFRRWKKKLYLRLRGTGIIRQASAIHCTTRREAEESARNYSPVPGFVVPNGIEWEEYRYLDRARSWELVRQTFRLPDKPFVLFLGRIHPKKGLHLLLPAFRQGAPASHTLVVAGPAADSYGRILQRQAGELGIQDRTFFVGPVYGGKKTALLAAADLFVLPSSQENFGIAVVESLAAGTPVLLSEHVDICNEVSGAGVGWTVPLVADQWAAELGKRLADPRALDALRDRGRRWVAGRFAWHTISDLLLEQYERVLAGRVGLDQTKARAALDGL